MDETSEQRNVRLGGGDVPVRDEEVTNVTKWSCSQCGFVFDDETVPDRCPSCKEPCTFRDVTCYVPECGGPDNIDPRLVGKGDKPIND